MHPSTLLLPLFAVLARADFQIYSDQDYTGGDPLEGVTGAAGFHFVNSEPSCDDINHSVFEPGVEDASGSRDGVRCEGCDENPPADWDISELEWNTDMGHFTIYEDAGYQITPADGSAIRGYCVKDTGDDFQCSFGLGDNDTGNRLFICYSDLTAPTV